MNDQYTSSPHRVPDFHVWNVFDNQTDKLVSGFTLLSKDAAERAFGIEGVSKLVSSIYIIK